MTVRRVQTSCVLSATFLCLPACGLGMAWHYLGVSFSLLAVRKCKVREHLPGHHAAWGRRGPGADARRKGGVQGNVCCLLEPRGQGWQLQNCLEVLLSQGGSLPASCSLGCEQPEVFPLPRKFQLLANGSFSMAKALPAVSQGRSEN